MPSDLFGDVAAHRSGPRSRRSSLLIYSALGHVAIFLLVIVASLRAIGPLPDPRTPIAPLVPTRIVEIKDPPRPAAPEPARPTENVAQVSSLAPSTQVDDQTLAPVKAADTIAAPASDDRPRAEPGGGTETPGALRIAIPHVARGGDGTGIGPIQPVVGPPPAPRRTAQRVGPGIREPKKIANTTPTYPMVAQAARIQGTVILEITVGMTGVVEHVDVLRSIPMLDQAAIDAVRRWKYEPAQLNGAPIPVIITVTVNFALER